jgi:flagellar biosynthesis protein FlhB
MKKLAFLIYAWGSTALFLTFLFWLATIPNLEASESSEMTDQIIKVLFRMVLYSLLFIFIFRSIIITLKSTISRLSSWRSKREKIEDLEFVLIIETLVTVVAILASILIAIAEEAIQINISGRSAEIVDILVSVIAILITAIVSYSMPVIGELEIAILHKIKEKKYSE